MSSYLCAGRAALVARILLVWIFLVFVSGCASVLKGTTQNVPISSDPTGADILLDGTHVGVTPADIRLQRKRDHLVSVQMDGYQGQNVPVVKSVGGAVWGNILAGGFIGWGVDAATGAQYNLTPETIFVQLRAVGEAGNSAQTQDDGTEVISQLNQLDEMRENDQINADEYTRMRLALLEQHFPEMVEHAAQEADDSPDEISSEGE